MRKGIRFLGIGLAFLLVLLLAFAVTLILHNLQDDDLLPEITQLLQKRPEQIAAADNGYFAWLGVVGPADVDPHTWGQRWYAQALKADREGVWGPLPIESEIDTSFEKMALPFCNKAASCLKEVADQQALAHETLKRYRTLIARCDSMLTYRDYQEAWRPDLTLTSWFANHPYECRRLSALRIALAVAEGRDSEAIAHLEAAIALHILQLKGSNTLLDKLVAVIHLRTDYLLLNDYLSKRPEIARTYREKINGMLAPLDDETRSMARVLETEWLLSARGTLDFEKHLSSWEDDETGPGLLTEKNGITDRLTAQLLFLPKATVNETYQGHTELVELEQLTGEEYRTAVSAIYEREKTDSGFNYSYLSLRNPVGKILHSIARPNMLHYLRTRDDLLALRRAVSFHHKVIQSEPHKIEIKDALEDARLLHRFTGKQAIWDEESREVVYPCSAQLDVDEIRIGF